MKKLLLATLLASLCLGINAQRSVYAFDVEGMNGEQQSLRQYKGKVLLIVNTATQCGFTSQYEELQALYDKYRDCGFEVLDFPCNQFGAQAPGSIQEIHNFCTSHFSTTFPQFAKIDVNGDAASPLFTFLKKKQRFSGFDVSTKMGALLDGMLRKADPEYDRKPDIKWNFTKFLVNRKGKVVRRFEPTEPMTAVETAVKQILGK